MDAWRELAEERRLAEARLGVGLSLVVRRGPAPREVTVDDGQPEVIALEQPIEANTRLCLRLGEEVELELHGGRAEARVAREQLERRWEAEVAPRLAALGLTDLTAVEQRRRAAVEQRQELERLHQRARSDRELAAAQQERADELPALRRSLEAAQQALAGLDLQALEARVNELDEATLQRRHTHAGARVDEAQLRHGRAKARAAGLKTEQQARAQEHERLAAALAEARARMSAEPGLEREAAFDRLAAVEGELETVAGELEALELAQTRERERLESAEREADAHAARHREALSAARRQADALRSSLAQAEGRLAQVQQHARKIDEPAARAEVERLRAERDALPLPAREVTPEALEAVEQAASRQRLALREVEAALGEQRGALKQVGGAVTREAAERTREALEVAKRNERDLELDYDAWRLLAATLREAETAEGRHLGEALGEPVHSRFAALTGDRYGPLSLGRNLRAQGMEVAGQLRDLGAFSEGVQDQLATILRLAVAEHLGTALVLDDHLAQTDPSRVAWFREVLQEVSTRAQIIVLTCRPEDYLRDEERPGADEDRRDVEGLRAIDLRRVIRRG